MKRVLTKRLLPAQARVANERIETSEFEEALLPLSRFQHRTLATRVDVDACEVTAIFQAPQLADKRKSEVLEMLDAEVDRIIAKLANLPMSVSGS